MDYMLDKKKIVKIYNKQVSSNVEQNRVGKLIKNRQTIFEEIVKTATGTDITILDTKNDTGKITGFECVSTQVVTVQGKNLFDKNKANLLLAAISSDTTIISSSADRVLYIPCNPSTTYTVSRTLIGGRFRLGTTATLPIIGSSVAGLISNYTGSYITITTNSVAKYMCVWYYSTATDVQPELNYRSAIQVELGSTATAYASFIPNSPSTDYPSPILSSGDGGTINTTTNGVANTPITLPVGYVGGSLPNGVKDTHDMQRIGKVVLNGSESSWNNVSQSVGNANYYYCYTNLIDVLVKNKANNTIINEYCNNYKVISDMTTGTVVTQDSLSVQYVGTLKLRVMILKSRVDAMAGGTTIIKLQAYLASNNVTVYYELATPIAITPVLPTIATTQDLCVVSSTNAVKPSLTVKYLEK